MFKPIRRKERELPENTTRQLLETGEYGILSMCGANAYGYGIPLSHALEGDRIYFHGAAEGFKLESLQLNDRVSFCVVGATEVIPRHFSTNYQSAIAFGRIVSVANDEERMHALRLLGAKYSPGFPAEAEKYMKVSLQRTHILRLDIEHLSGKGRQIGNPHTNPDYK